MSSAAVDVSELEAKVKQLYRVVAQQPHGTYHFEMGRALGPAAAPAPHQRPAGPHSGRGGRVLRRRRLLLRPGRLQPGERVLDLGCGRGRLALADIITRVALPHAIVCDPDLWASCIGGAAQLDAYQEAIEAAGCRVELMKRNPYEFLSGNARGASATHGVRSVSLLARKVT